MSKSDTSIDADQKPSLRAASEIDSVRKRRNALFRFSESAKPSDFDLYKAIATSDTDPQVRAFALRGLARTGSDRANSELCAAIEDKDRFVKITVLRELRDELSTADFEKLEPLADDADSALRAGVATAIGNTRSRIGLPLLEKCLNDRRSAVRTRAVHALVKLSGPEAKAILQRRRSKEGWFGRRQIDRAIGEIDSSV